MSYSSEEVGSSNQMGRNAVEELFSEVQAFHRAVMRDRDYESDSEYYEFAILHENGVRTERGYRIPRFKALNFKFKQGRSRSRSLKGVAKDAE